MSKKLMTKDKMIKKVRKIMIGESSHTHGSISKLGRSWSIETSMSPIIR